jgi:cell division protein FtsX
VGLGENTRSAMFISFATITFIIAVSICYYLFRTTNDVIDLTNKSTTQMDKNIQSTLKVPVPYTVTGAEVRQSIHQIRDIDVDIVVNGVTFSKALDPTIVNVSGIPLNKNYTPTYERDQTGHLTRLLFN